LHATVVDAMREAGVDISDRKPKGFTDDDVRWADVVVTMGCGDVCPYFPGKQYVDWNLPDPVGMSLDDVRVLRDEIARRVTELPL
jgi:arsenate reductase